jgi:hypothetical protein
MSWFWKEISELIYSQFGKLDSFWEEVATDTF